jgi:hypothetical protein
MPLYASLGATRNCEMMQCGTRDYDMFGELLVFERRHG